MCRAVPCCAVLSALLYLLFRACTAAVVPCQVPAELSLAQQVSSGQLSSAVHRSTSSAGRSAMPCRTVPYVAGRRRAVP